MARRIRAAADHVVRAPVSLGGLHRTIADCRLDVLFYPDIGMSPLTYYLAFARLAPVQCTTWGHPVTSGLATVDHFVSAEHLESPGSQAQYTERLHLLSAPGTYYPKPRAPDAAEVGAARARFGLRPEWHVYLCAQSLFKIHPEFDAVLAAILRGDPRGRVVLVGGRYHATSAALLGRLRATLGDDTNRVTVLPQLSAADFLALLAAADANLDTFHFGGGHTSLEAFAVGSPVVTLPSAFLRGRITYALYRQVGVTQCVATDAEHYVQLALRLANDPAWRREVSEAIVGAHDRLFENAAVVGEFEGFFSGAATAASGRGSN
jgi:predicted O-linked N-acetylglucosamine transferase (SPINDLY family)